MLLLFLVSVPSSVVQPWQTETLIHSHISSDSCLQFCVLMETSVDEVYGQMKDGFIKDLENATVEFHTVQEQHLRQYQARVLDLISIWRKDFVERPLHLDTMDKVTAVHENTQPPMAVIQEQESTPVIEKPSHQRTFSNSGGSHTSSRWFYLPSSLSTMTMPTKKKWRPFSQRRLRMSGA